MAESQNVDKGIVRLFMKGLTRFAPFGDDLLRRLELSSTATRRLCGQLAAASGYHTVARNIARW